MEIHALLLVAVQAEAIPRTFKLRALVVPEGMICPAGRSVAAALPLLTVKAVVEVPVPPGAVTEIAPEVAPAGTITVIRVSLFTVKVLALVPLNETAVAPVKAVPVITTLALGNPEVGVKLVMVGWAAETVTVKEVEETPVPEGDVTEMVPVVAPLGTVAVSCEPDWTVNVDAAVPWNETAVAPVNWVP
jgi:hypothetical protein